MPSEQAESVVSDKDARLACFSDKYPEAPSKLAGTQMPACQLSRLCKHHKTTRLREQGKVKVHEPPCQDKLAAALREDALQARNNIYINFTSEESKKHR